MGQSNSLKPGASDVKSVKTIDDAVLLSAIKTILNEKNALYFKPEDIVRSAMLFLEKSVEKKYTEWKTPLKLEEMKENCEILIRFESIGEVVIRSGHGGHRLIIIGDIGGYQIMLLEHMIKTTEITEKLLNSLNHLMASESATLMNNLRSEQVQSTFSNVRSFVQIYSTYDWKNASISFHSIFPLVIESGNGFCRFEIGEILKAAKESIEPYQQNLLKWEDQFAKLRTSMLKKKELLERQNKKMPNKFVQNQESENSKPYNLEIRNQVEGWNTKIQAVDEENRLIKQRQNEIKTMTEVEKEQEKVVNDTKSKLIKIERDLKERREKLAKIKQQNRDRINEWSKNMEEKYSKIEQEEQQSDEIGIATNVEETKHENANEYVEKEIPLKKINARKIGKLIVDFCGIEGAEKSPCQLSLQKELTDLIDFYKKHEKENYWNNVSIQIYNQNDYYHIRVGKEKTRIMITSTNSNTNIQFV